mmetsp:Transcript_15536/g.20428  ORF Transcript_15536/g.20428 Transcript_15536/m.20428 type:complete len:92 (-) Transcript_15536:662-937(-)
MIVESVNAIVFSMLVRDGSQKRLKSFAISFNAPVFKDVEVCSGGGVYIGGVEAGVMDNGGVVDGISQFRPIMSSPALFANPVSFIIVESAL